MGGLNPKKARPSFVAATAGQSEGSRRISGRRVVFGRLAGVSVLEYEGTSPVPLRRRGRAKRAAPSDVRAIECIVGTSQSPRSLLRHRCGRPAPRAPSNVSAMRGSPGPTTVGPVGVRSYLAAAAAGLRVRAVGARGTLSSPPVLRYCLRRPASGAPSNDQATGCRRGPNCGQRPFV